MIYRIADQMPEFPGGIKALQNFISGEIKYPKKAIKNKLSGRVFVSFVVDKSGQVKNVCVNRGVSPELDKEAVRIISSLPQWTPGKQKGNFVNVAYTVPVLFKFENFLVQPVIARNPVVVKIKNASDYHLDNILNLTQFDSEYSVIEKMPQFPGGSENLRKFVANNIKYPILAAEQGYEGLVYVKFNVNKDGRVSDARIIKGANVELNNEAIRVINSMPYWIPGEQQGKKVKVSYTIPIRFALN
jgi:TonB family protein